MSRKSHYTTLDIPRSATPGRIRAAYLRLAKTLHPDHAGGPGSRAFREVQNAYDTLSDPAKRRRYDDWLQQRHAVAVRRAAPRHAPSAVEPLVPVESDATPLRSRRSWPPAGRTERLAADVTPLGESPVPSINIDVKLPAAEVVGGAVVTVGVPIITPCPVCAGTGVDWPFACSMCRSRGSITREHLVRLPIPSDVRHGDVLRLAPADTRGLELHVRILLDMRWRAPPFAARTIL